MNNPRQDIIEICRRLNSKDMLAAADGNVSYKISENEILITPTGKNKAHLKPEDIAVITQANEIRSGKPSGERLMHLEVYNRCPSARCVVHAHPPVSIAWSVAQPNLKELPANCLSEVILAVGRIPIVPYARPGTQSMGDHLREFLPNCRVMILSRHGALSWGEDLDEAYNGMERLEHSAKILMNSKLLGSLTELPKEEVDVLHSIRAKLGDRSL
ncbi:MAG: class II aldolase/adducin family protein [Bacteriovoracia bacterium]